MLDVLKHWAESEGWRVRSRVCRENEVNLDTDAEVVAFSVYTFTANAIYRVAEKLRANRKIVIFGGPHFSSPQTYDEAKPYCDVLVNSICEDQWKNLLTHISQGGIQPHHQRPVLIVDMEKNFRFPTEPYLTYDDKKWFQYPCIPVSLGCPYQCVFCSPYMGGKYVLRDIDVIRNEVAQVGLRLVFLSDATFGLNKRHTQELMTAIAPLKKTIVVETSVARMQDREFIEYLALGGVKLVMVGVETLSAKMTKHGTGALNDTLKDVIQCAHDNGIVVQGNFIAGLDSDGPDSFDLIYECYHKTKIDSFLLGLLVPYPNTVLYRQLQDEGRIIDTNWEHYDSLHVVYQPKKMTIDQLVNGYTALMSNVYNTRQVMRDSLQTLKTTGMTPWGAFSLVNKLGFFLAHLYERKIIGNEFSESL
jgi:radical SAM superfamily enzyme YgiQ (UPF0313 family)